MLYMTFVTQGAGFSLQALSWRRASAFLEGKSVCCDFSELTRVYDEGLCDPLSLLHDVEHQWDLFCPFWRRVAAEDWRLHWEEIYKPRLGNVAAGQGGCKSGQLCDYEALSISRWVQNGTEKNRISWLHEFPHCSVGKIDETWLWGPGDFSKQPCSCLQFSPGADSTTMTNYYSKNIPAKWGHVFSHSQISFRPIPYRDNANGGETKSSLVRCRSAPSLEGKWHVIVCHSPRSSCVLEVGWTYILL